MNMYTVFLIFAVYLCFFLKKKVKNKFSGHFKLFNVVIIHNYGEYKNMYLIIYIFKYM